MTSFKIPSLITLVVLLSYQTTFAIDDSLNITKKNYSMVLGETQLSPNMPLTLGFWYMPTQLIGRIDSSIFTYYQSRNKVVISSYNANSLKKQNSTNCRFTFGYRKRFFEKAILFSETVCVFFSVYDKKTDIKKLYCERYSAKDLSLLGEPIEIISFSHAHGYSGKYHFLISDDQSLFAIFVDPFFKDYDHVAQANYPYVIYDELFKNLANTSFIPPVLEKKTTLSQLHLSDMADLYLLSSSENSHSIYKLNRLGNASEFRLSIKISNPNDVVFRIDDRDNLCCTGFCHGDASLPFFVKYDYRKEKILCESDNLRTVGEAFSSSVSEYLQSNLIFIGNREFISIAEEVNTANDTYGNITITKFSDQGEELWRTTIKKFQDDPILSSYLFHVTERFAYIIYSEHNDAEVRKSWDEKDFNSNRYDSRREKPQMAIVDLKNGTTNSLPFEGLNKTGMFLKSKYYFSDSQNNRLYFCAKTNAADNTSNKEMLGYISF